MAKILYCWELGAGLGHLTVIRPVLERLLQAGHKIAAIVCDATHAPRYLGSLGIRFAHLKRTPARPEQTIKPLRTFAHVLHNSVLANSNACVDLSRSVQTLVRDFRPDLVICDHAPHTLMAIRGVDVRSIVWGTGFTCPPDCSPLPDWRPWQGNSHDQLIADETHTLDELNDVLAKLGKPLCHLLTDLYTEATATLLTTYAELDHFPARREGNYVGIWNTIAGAAPTWPQGNGPRVFAYLKPTTELNLAVESLAALGYPALLFSPGGEAQVQDKLPPNIRLFSEPLDMEHVAKAADIALLNGTHTTVAQMLRAGKPVVTLPLLLEQQLTGLAVAKLRAGEAVLEPTATKLSETLVGVATKQYPGAQTFAEKYQELTSEIALDRVMRQIDVFT